MPFGDVYLPGKSGNLPVLWHVPQPLHPRVLEPDVGIQAPGDGLVDQCLPLLLQQGDEPLLAGDVALDLLVGVVEEPDDGGLFFGRWRYGNSVVAKF